MVAKTYSYDETDHEEIKQLLVGHKVVKVADDTLTLDDGRLLKFRGNEGGCSCGSGDYELTELNGTDNLIMNVEFEDSPDGDWTDHGDGRYRIFVFADNQKINLATFEGSDGNGYYGTGYSITVTDIP